MAMKLSIKAQCIMSAERQANQWTVTILKKGKATRTLTFTAHSDIQEADTLKRFLLDAFLQECEWQHAYAFVSDDAPWQEDLPC